MILWRYLHSPCDINYSFVHLSFYYVHYLFLKYHSCNSFLNELISLNLFVTDYLQLDFFILCRPAYGKLLFC